jgi:hypothetical protein
VSSANDKFPTVTGPVCLGALSGADSESALFVREAICHYEARLPSCEWIILDDRE